MARELSETRKADRLKMATRLAEVVKAAGGTCEKGVRSRDPACLIVTITGPGGARMTVDFDGRSSQPNTFVCSWHMDIDSDDRFAPAFGSVNPCHFAKATDVAHDFAGLCWIVDKRVRQLVDGTAYSAERKAAMILKNGGTAADRNARFAEYFAREVGAAA